MGEGVQGVRAGRQGGAHLVRGLKVDTLGDEVLEAVELAFGSRMHEGRVAALRRHGGHTRSAAAVRARGSRDGGRRGRGWWSRVFRGQRAAGRAALTSFVASRLAPLAMRCSRQSSLPLIAVHMRAVSPSYGDTCGGATRDQRRL